MCAEPDRDGDAGELQIDPARELARRREKRGSTLDGEQRLLIFAIAGSSGRDQELRVSLSFTRLLQLRQELPGARIGHMDRGHRVEEQLLETLAPEGPCAMESPIAERGEPERNPGVGRAEDRDDRADDDHDQPEEDHAGEEHQAANPGAGTTLPRISSPSHPVLLVPVRH
jgi:hypothetical protein